MTAAGERKICHTVSICGGVSRRSASISGTSSSAMITSWTAWMRRPRQLGHPVREDETSLQSLQTIQPNALRNTSDGHWLFEAWMQLMRCKSCSVRCQPGKEGQARSQWTNGQRRRGCCCCGSTGAAMGARGCGGLLCCRAAAAGLTTVWLGACAATTRRRFFLFSCDGVVT